MTVSSLFGGAMQQQIDAFRDLSTLLAYDDATASVS
jgi:hypothetical protein